MTTKTQNFGPLTGLKVIDMSRILAGPSATQILGDFGADIIKIERPHVGDDTRKWGPPFALDDQGNETSESSYYLSTNRNKRSIAIDFRQPEGQKILIELIGKADILVENYKTGTLKKYNLDYNSLKQNNPGLIYCSLTGFGQTGPYADKAGYDFLVQAMGGIMSLTGPVGGPPFKTGVAITDLMAGMYMLTGILAALHYRNTTGEGQFIDTALLDTQVSWLSNAAQYYLTSGTVTPRMGNAHPTIVPYEVFQTQDDYIVLAIGNDKQFQSFCDFVKRSDLAEHPDYQHNTDRVKNRDILIPQIQKIIAEHSQKYWIKNLADRHVPCGPVNDLEQVFNDPQVLHREMLINMKHCENTEPLKLVGNPLKFSKTPVSYRHAPPTLGQNTQQILKDWIQLSDSEIKTLHDKDVIS